MGQVTMTRKDWGGLMNGFSYGPAVMERIGKLRWDNKTAADDGEALTIELSEQEVNSIFDPRKGFGSGGYLNTVEVYREVARIYTAFGFQPPTPCLPHDGSVVRFSDGKVIRSSAVSV